MGGRRTLRAVTLALAACAAAARAAGARVVAPGEDVQAAVEAERPGGTVELLPGPHRGPVLLNRAVALAGQEGAVLEGPGEGSVVTVAAEGAAVRGLTLRGSGSSLDAMDSGVLLRQSARGAVVEGNRIEGNLAKKGVRSQESGIRGCQGRGYRRPIMRRLEPSTLTPPDL